MLTVELVGDQEQYNHTLSPISEALKGLGVEVVHSQIFSRHFDADCHLLVQDVGLATCPAPCVVLPHGLAPLKRFGFNFGCDLLIVPSQSLFEIMKGGIAAKNVVVGSGYPKIDLLLDRAGKASEIKGEIRHVHGFDDRPIVGYFPTFKHNGELQHDNRLYRLEDVEAALAAEFNVVVLYHQLEMASDQVAALRFSPSPQISRPDYIAGVDLVVTDTSGIGLEAAAIDKPIVLLDNPGIPTYFTAAMLPDAPILDYGPKATLENLCQVVREHLAQPSAYAERRSYWAAKMLGPADGLASSRIAKALVDLAEAHRITRGVHSSVEAGRSLSSPNIRHRNILVPAAMVKSFVANAACLTTRKPATGVLMFGPFITLPAGAYRLDVDIQSDASQRYVFEITSNASRSVFSSTHFMSNLVAGLCFKLDEDVRGIEFRLIAQDSARGHDILVRKLDLSWHSS